MHGYSSRNLLLLLLCLSSKPKDCVIIRNKNDEYSGLYSIVLDVLSKEKLEMQSNKIHQKIDKVICNFFVCF